MLFSIKTFLIVCPLLFAAGFIDAIGGGGGLISLPAYLIAGLPVHQAIATNKLSSTAGTSLVAIRFIKNGLVSLRFSIPSVIAAITGSFIGAHLSLKMEESVMEYLLFFLLPLSAFLVLNKKLFSEHADSTNLLNQHTCFIACLSAFVIGIYDGFYGPGTGTFLIIAFTLFAKFRMDKANAQAKIINLTTNVTSLVIFLLNKQVLFSIGIAAALCNMAGGYLGAGLAITKGSRIIKPMILLVLALLFMKLLINYFI